MMPAVDMSGQRCGRLLVIQRSHTGADRRVYWHCLCDCGAEIVSLGQHLRRGNVKSCGCLLREADHGSARRGHKTAEYFIWVSMHQRCSNPNHKSFPDYGGRGIFVCERWKSYAAFIADMGVRPSSSHSIDRRDNDGPYSPDNCRWATPAQQCANRRPRRWGKRPVHLAIGAKADDAKAGADKRRASRAEAE